MIRSQLHKLLELLPKLQLQADRVLGGRVKLVNFFETAPHYVFSEEIVDLLTATESAIKSIETLIECQVLHLPFAEMCLQFPSPGCTWFAAIEEANDKFYTYMIGLQGESYVDLGPVVMTPTLPGPEKPGGFECQGPDLETSVAIAHSIAVRLAVLMTHIAGLEREVHEAPVKLNKARAKQGKIPIHHHEYIHVGKVYDSAGRAHSRTGTGRHMPIHMRAGHSRTQRFGKGLEESKLIWIPPVIVNYHPDGEQKRYERRIVK